jgi:hypothetical protein
MDEYMRFNWTGYGRPDCKLTMHLTPTAYAVAKQQEEEFHAAVAERRLEEEGIKPELNLYLIGIGGVAR